jgi:DNA (cytosine-5)-methyltransferase 1
MTIAYYNENDAGAAAWLRELIKEGHIAHGEVDTRSIEDVVSSELVGFAQCHFFAGIGGWSYALRLAGWPDERAVWTGSCPCQPFSAAGKGAGFADERHLWPAWCHLIEQLLPITIFGEQVARKAGLQWLRAVQTDLEIRGYAIGAAILPAASVGAPHNRERIYFVARADADSFGLQRFGELEKSSQAPLAVNAWGTIAGARFAHPKHRSWWQSEPVPEPLAHGVPARVGLLRGYGNAIVPQVAAAFIEAYLTT